MKKINWPTVLSVVAMGLCGLGTLLGDWSNNKKMEQEIEEKVREALAKEGR